MNKVAITGARGFIGSHLIKHFDKAGIAYLALKRTDNDFIYPPNWEEFEVIIHLAARVHLKKSGKTSLSYTLNLAEKAVASNITQFIFISSVNVLGEYSGEKPFDENSPYNPCNDYSVSKVEAELELKRVFKDTDVMLTIIRPPLVYGPGVKGNFRTLVKLATKTPVLPLGGAESRRSFCSVNNLCDLIITCLNNEKSYDRTFLVSDDNDVTTVEFIRLIYGKIRKTYFIIPAPYLFMYLAGLVTSRTQTVTKLYKSLTLDISHTKETLGWTPPYAMEQEISRALNDDQAA